MIFLIENQTFVTYQVKPNPLNILLDIFIDLWHCLFNCLIQVTLMQLVPQCKGGGAQHNYAHQHQIDLEAAWPGKTAQKTVVRIAFCLLQKTLKGFDIFCVVAYFLIKEKNQLGLLYTSSISVQVLFRCSSKSNWYVTIFLMASFIMILVY